MIHLNSKACDGNRLTLFQRDFLRAYEVIDRSLHEVVNRYFIQHALSWLSPHNVAQSLYSENPPFTKEALTSLSSLLKEVSVENLPLLLLEQGFLTGGKFYLLRRGVNFLN